jgi:hypothetical protein
MRGGRARGGICEDACAAVLSMLAVIKQQQQQVWASARRGPCGSYAAVVLCPWHPLQAHRHQIAGSLLAAT